MAAKSVPPLPSGSVDLSVLHAAEAKNEDLGKAIERATIRAEAVAIPKPETKAAPHVKTAGKTAK